jgi:8-oxo-dGTP pyrophosphatase MutT (NUDIX family)
LSSEPELEEVFVNKWTGAMIVGERGPNGRLSKVLVQNVKYVTGPYASSKPKVKVPGGKRKPEDANVFATALRELEEETGLTLRESAPVWEVYKNHHDDEGGDHFIEFYFVWRDDCDGELFKGVTTDDSAEISNRRFVTLEIAARTLIPTHLEALRMLPYRVPYIPELVPN